MPYYAAGWREVIRQLIDARGLTMCRLTCTSRDSQRAKAARLARCSAAKYTSWRCANGAAFDDFLFRRLMDDARGDSINWTANDLSDAFTSLAERDSLLPAEKHAEVLSKLVRPLARALAQDGRAIARSCDEAARLACAHVDRRPSGRRTAQRRVHGRRPRRHGRAAQSLGAQRWRWSRPLFAADARGHAQAIGIRGNEWWPILMRLSAESTTTPKQLQPTDIPRLAYIGLPPHRAAGRAFEVYAALGKRSPVSASTSIGEALQQALIECMLQLHSAALAPACPRTRPWQLAAVRDV